MSERLIVTVQHLHTVPTWTTRTGYCAKQSRAFFAEQGLDYPPVQAGSKAKARLGWQPQVELEQGLSMTVDWIRRNLHLFRPDQYQR